MPAQDAYAAEVQQIFRSRYLDLTAGAGYFNVDGEIAITIGFPDFSEQAPPLSLKYDHVNGYVYANVKPATTLDLTVGGSYDRVEGDLPEESTDQFNPKFGLIWNPFPATTIRAAAFKTLKRTLITDQTLEPTQVAGFNQFYDESDLTDSWRYGAGIDQTIGHSVFAGAEYSERDMTVPLVNAMDGMVVKPDWAESLTRVYLFAAPHPWLGLRAQYIRETFDREEGLGLGFKELDTQRVPLGLGFFHPSGLSASVTATYWNQEGQFEDFFGPPGSPLRAGSSEFWLVDAAISFRLPKRFGFLSVGATNLSNKDFDYFEVDIGNLTIQPKRTIYAKVTLAVP